jgi:hypothetical protein
MILAACKASEQFGYGVPAKDAVKHVGDSVKVEDVVTKMKQGTDSTFLEIGNGTKRNRLVVILIGDGNKQFQPRASGYPINHRINVIGVVSLYKGRPCVLLTHIYNDIVIVH